MTSSDRILAIITAAEGGIRVRCIVRASGVCENWCKELMARLRAEAKVSVVRYGKDAIWCAPGRREEIILRLRARSVELERARIRRKREKDIDAAPDMPVVQRIVCARSVPPIQQLSARSVFEWRPGA